MEAADLYAWLNRPTARNGCDGFDAHIVAAILAIGISESANALPAIPRAVGLDGDDLAGLAGEMFPHAQPVFARLCGHEAGAPTEDEACLRQLLRVHTTDGTALQMRLADMLARRCLRPNHLWQDLGLRNRRELSWLMARHFEPLATRNRHDMKWKKFFYRTICRDDGFLLCAAPVCSECDDFANCCGDETSESLLARTRNPIRLSA
jgi:nitrogen fixation protein NifQ